MRVSRVLDLVLLLPTAPLFGGAVGVLAIVAKVGQGGPVFFVQERVGEGGRPFRVYKIRTMSTEPDPQARTVTPLGGWLRQRGLDELPQLWCVFTGDMRLVGPRPLTVADHERLCAAHPGFERRTSVPPGLTGLAQACQAVGIEQTSRLERWYADHGGVVFDLRILARTAWMNVVGKRRGKWKAERFTELSGLALG